MRITASLAVSIALACAACSDDSSTPNAAQNTPDAQQPEEDASIDPCSATALREPSAATTYYLAVEEPGADNEACDGLAPTDEGDGHCPFKDFSSERTRTLLTDVKNTRVELRAGTYVISGWDGLRVSGTGTSDAERLVLSAYPGEHPVLDVPAPDGAGCTAMTAMEDPDCVRQVLRIAGSYTQVQGLTIRNGLAYHAEINGGAEHVFRCNSLGETVAFSMRSDLLKIDGHASDVLVLNNDLHHFRSQAIDMTQVDRVFVRGNSIHDPIDDDAGATGCKYGARNVTIEDNDIFDFGDDPQSHVFSLGGTGTEHDDPQTALGIHVQGNRVHNVPGLLAQLVSCAQCSITDNTVVGAGGGILISAAALGTAECTASPTGCAPSSDAVITGNRMRELRGGNEAGSADAFIIGEAGEGAGIQHAQNLYCASEPDAAHFGWNGIELDFEAFREQTDDVGSRLLPSTDPDCAFGIAR